MNPTLTSAPAKIVTRDHPDWDEARMAWNLHVDQQPAAVAFPETDEDVIDAIMYARIRKLRVAPQTTGHNAGPLADSLEDALLLKTTNLRGVQVDPIARTARVRGGSVWADVVGPAAEHGLIALQGSSHDVGVAGYTLGGGMSFMARKYGLSANNVTAIEIVTADGCLHRVDADNEPDLFWALRGGGGNFGVVTAIEIKLFPADGLYGGWLVFPIERGAEVLEAWRQWTATAPDEVTSVGRLLQVPPLPDIPEAFRGRRLAVIETIHLHGQEIAEELLAPLRALGPEIDTHAPLTPSGLLQLHMDPPQPVPGIGDHMLLGKLPARAITKLIDAAGADSGSPLLSVELRHMGGALGRSEPGHGATAMLEGEFAMFAVGMAMGEDMAAAVGGYLPVVKDAMAEWDSGREYLNFAEQSTDARRIFAMDDYRRLRQVKAAYDPDDVFRANHRITPTR